MATTEWVELRSTRSGVYAPQGVNGGAALEATSAVAAGAAPRAVAPPATALGREPGALQCLRCQLLGRRRLTCARRELCLEPPRVRPIGAMLLLAWLATAAAFVVSVW